MLFDLSSAIEIFKTTLLGIPTTILVTVGTLAVSLPLGLLIAVIRVNHFRILDQLAAIYVSVIRGVPLVIQIFLIFNIVPRLVVTVTQSRDIFHVNPILYAFLVFWLGYTALLSEVFRSAIIALDPGQLEAACSVGMTAGQAYRRILLPQMLTSALPNIGNITLGLIKGSSLVYLMGIQDITAYAIIAAAGNLRYFEAYLDIFIIYLVICVAVNKLFEKVEIHLRKYQFQA